MSDIDKPGEHALTHWWPLFEADPTDNDAANMVGRSLQELGRLDEAKEHWELVVEAQPSNSIAASRAKDLRHRPRTDLGGAGETLHDPDEINALWHVSTAFYREWLVFLAREPGRRYTHPQLESGLGWPPLRARAVASSMSRIVRYEFDGRWLPQWAGAAQARSGRFETWLDTAQASVIRELAE